MAEISEYEQLRLKRIEENRHMLFQLGLLPEDWKPPAFKPQNPFIRRPVSVKKKKRVESSDDLLPSRRSLRSVNSNDFEDGELTDSINGDYAESDCSNSSKEKYIKNRVNSYGAIEGVAVGEIWETRMECSRAGIHRPPVSGIHPGPEGAYSIALSGGYEDNYDGGESFTYTGAGGRDLRGTTDKPKNLRTGPQVKDQILEGANASLANSVKTRKPVRVIRGYKSNSPFAPEFGYRYDGLYQVEKYWTTKGLSGHLVYKFALKRCPDQDPPPWATDVEDSTDESTMKPSSKDGDNLNDSMNPFVHLGKKVDDLNDLDELETNEKLHTPYKKSEKEEAINNSVDVLGVKNNLNNSFDTIKNDNSSLSCTPELNGNDKRKSKKVSPEKSSASVHKNVSPKDVLRSPKKISPKNSPLKNKSDATATTPSKSPVKMIASNQSLDELSVISTDYNDVKNVSLELGKSPKVQRTLSNNSKPNLSKAPTSDSNPDSSLSNNKEVPENENIVQNNPLPVSFKDTTGYLKSRRRSQDGSSNVNNTGKKKGKKRSPSPDDFAKICDELCNELPKIEKVKRLRFSFDNFSDNDLEVNVVKARRKRASRTPRKSSLIKDMKQKSVKDFEDQNKSNEDLVFSKFIDIWLADFSFDESFNDWLGWDDYDLFEGWSDKEVTEAKKYSASFADFIFKCNENSEENSWAGWEDDVSRRSLVLNGFLLEEMSRNRRCSDSDGTEAPEEFLGFQQQNRVQKTD